MAAPDRRGGGGVSSVDIMATGNVSAEEDYTRILVRFVMGGTGMQAMNQHACETRPPDGVGREGRIDTYHSNLPRQRPCR